MGMKSFRLFQNNLIKIDPLTLLTIKLCRSVVSSLQNEDILM